LKADAEFELEGILILSVVAPRRDKRNESERIEILGSGQPDGPGVTTQLVGRSERPRRRDDDRPRRDGPRRDGPGREGPARGGRTGERPRPDGDRPARQGERAGSGERERTGGGDRERPRREGARREGERRGEGAGNRPTRPQGERRPGAEHTSSTASDRGRKRLNPGNTHRKSVMDSLAPEEQPVAEQLLRGGIPAVRTALHLEREKAEGEGRPAPNTDALLALAESLLPRLRAAEWRDRAEAAVAGIDDISLRDLRSVAAGADQARDDETRDLAHRLRDAIEVRVAKLHAEWVADITAQLDGGRPVRAVRLSSRPPDANARLDDELTARLVAAAGQTLGPDTAPDLWAAMLEAVSESPIRRSVVPAGLPADPTPELKRTAHQLSGSIPALAKMLGVTIPPPPVPTGVRRKPAGPRPPRPAKDTTAAQSEPSSPEATAGAAEPLDSPAETETSAAGAEIQAPDAGAQGPDADVEGPADQASPHVEGPADQASPDVEAATRTEASEESAP
jgi:hypothetical protein